MLFLQQLFISLERAIRITLIVLRQCPIAQIPDRLFPGIHVLLDRIDVQKDVNPLVVNAGVVSILMQALLV